MAHTLDEMMAEAVARTDGHCVFCGGTCRSTDARRHSDPGPYGDSAANFAAMCVPCQQFFAGKAPAPARRVFHFYDASRARLALRRFWNVGLFALSVTVYSALWGIAGLMLWHGIDSPFKAFGTALLMLFLISLAYRITVLRDTHRPHTQTVHHTFDPQLVRVTQE